jgi:transcriptional regulator with XRE-family HTH domain
MDIGKRLQELRQGRGLSQGDIEHRTGLFRCYISRVENGHTIPSLVTLEKMAQALDLELHQLLHTGDTKLATSKAPKRPHVTSDEHALLKVFGQLEKADKRLLLSMAHKMAAVKGQT